MKKLIISFFISLLFANNVWAYSCPMDTKVIDKTLDSLANSEEEFVYDEYVIQYLREVGETLHKSGDQEASVIVLKGHMNYGAFKLRKNNIYLEKKM